MRYSYSPSFSIKALHGFPRLDSSNPGSSAANGSVAASAIFLFLFGLPIFAFLLRAVRLYHSLLINYNNARQTKKSESEDKKVENLKPWLIKWRYIAWIQAFVAMLAVTSIVVELGNSQSLIAIASAQNQLDWFNDVAYRVQEQRAILLPQVYSALADAESLYANCSSVASQAKSIQNSVGYYLGNLTSLSSTTPETSPWKPHSLISTQLAGFSSFTVILYVLCCFGTATLWLSSGKFEISYKWRIGSVYLMLFVILWSWIASVVTLEYSAVTADTCASEAAVSPFIYRNPALNNSNIFCNATVDLSSLPSSAAKTAFEVSDQLSLTEACPSQNDEVAVLLNLLNSLVSGSNSMESIVDCNKHNANVYQLINVNMCGSAFNGVLLSFIGNMLFCGLGLAMMFIVLPLTAAQWRQVFFLNRLQTQKQ
jgi:hypothetical protein